MNASKIVTFLCPTKIYFGIHSHEKLKEVISDLGSKDILIFSDPNVASTKIHTLVENILKENHIRFEIFTDIETDPSAATVGKAYEICRTFQPSALLAIGGGSTIDVAKAVGILGTNGGRIHDYEGIDKFSTPPLPLIAIPTTAGTGSEVSGSCVITDTERDVKMSIRHARLNPARVAILDPFVLTTLPATVAAHAGMDAFVHAVESYLSLQASPLTDGINLYAIELIAKNIRSFVANRANFEAGGSMLSAAALAGIGFSLTGLGNVHCMARFVGAFFHVPHGLSNAVCLPYVSEFNMVACPEKFSRVAQAMGIDISPLTLMEGAQAAVSAMKSLDEDIGIPTNLKEIGVKEEAIPKMAQLAFKADYNRWNPRYTTEEDFVKLFRTAMG